MSQALSETIRTIRVGITGTSATESYTLAPGLAQYVESVYIEVTNGAASGVHPVLSIAEQAGVVIAKRRQGGTIAASGSGSATWALRLSGDEQADSGLTGVFYDTHNTGDYLDVAATGHAPAAYTVGGVNSNWTIGIYGTDDVVFGTNGAGAATWVTSDNNVTLKAPTLDMTVATQANLTLATVFLQSSVYAEVDARDFYFIMTRDFVVDNSSSTGDVYIAIRNGGKLEVQNHLGAPIFRVDENGDLHGKTGKSLVFDL